MCLCTEYVLMFSVVVTLVKLPTCWMKMTPFIVFQPGTILYVIWLA